MEISSASPFLADLRHAPHSLAMQCGTLCSSCHMRDSCVSCCELPRSANPDAGVLPVTACMLYIDEEPAIVAHSPEQARRLAVPYINKRQSIKLGDYVASLPAKVWSYDYDIEAWVLQR